MNEDCSGTGLGTALAKRLIHLMNGSFDIKSEPGRGTEVRMVLNHVLITTKADLVDSSIVVPKNGIAKLSVLLVDDVPINLKVLNMVCLIIGITDLVTVESGTAALEELRKRPFDLVLTDMRMPQMTGEELVRVMREEESLRHIPVIAVTADVNVNDNYDMTLFSGQVLKPVTLGKISQAITTLMNPVS